MANKAIADVLKPDESNVNELIRTDIGPKIHAANVPKEVHPTLNGNFYTTTTETE